MKKRTLLAVGVVTLLALLTLALPFLLEGRQLQERLLASVEDSLGVKATVDAVSWRWLPVPAITIRQLKAESATMALTVPTAYLLVNPVSYIFGEMSLLRARLIDADLTLKQLPTAAATSAPGISAGSLKIVNGRLHLPGWAASPDLNLQPFTVSDLDGTLSVRAATIKFQFTAQTDWAKSLTVSGEAGGDGYRLTGRGEAIDSARLLNAASPTSLLPSATGLTLSARLDGTATDRFHLRVTAIDAPFTLRVREQTLAAAAVDGFTLERRGNDFTIGLNAFTLRDPRLSLSGRIARQTPAGSPASAPEWSLDLSGVDIDLAAVRASLLTIFPQDPTTQKVCAIVKGGSAATARYTFNGTLADFSHLESMKIWAEARAVPVTIPHLDLVLDQASGPIAIIDGQLTGKGLTATIDKSQGENGDLLLDLRQDQHAFHLDLDLAADLEDLRDVLARIVPSPAFQDELSRFVTIDGQAQGHLRLGDDLRHLGTEVDVRAMTARGLYDRLPWPFTIEAGRLQVAPRQVDWQGVRGTVGGQRITTSQGRVSWPEAVQLDLQSLDADLDLKSLFAEGSLRTNSGTIALRDLFRGRVDDLAGKATIAATTLSGPANKPDKWLYHTELHGSDLTFDGTGLPPMHGQEVQAEISQQQVDFAGLFTLFGQELFLAGHHRHRFFDHWHGDLEIDGEIGQELGQWIKERDLLPVAMFPRLPCRLEEFAVSNQESGSATFQARGTILALPADSGARMEVNIGRVGDQVNNTVTFKDASRRGILNYQTWPAQRRTLLTWQGAVAVQTIDALLVQHLLQSGEIQGGFSRLVDHDTTSYAGTFQAANLTLGSDTLLPDLTINDLRLDGNGNTFTVDKADLLLAEVPTTVSGKVTEAEGRHHLDLQVTAPRMSWASINTVFDDYKQRQGATDAESKPSRQDSLRGRIGFDLGTFDYTRPLPPTEGGGGDEPTSQALSSSPLIGTLHFSPTGIEVQVDRSNVCGIASQGRWYFRDEGQDNTVTFTSGTTPLSFAEALPCLGIKQSLIVGPFSLDGKISGRPRHWRQGNVTLTSPSGVIKKMTLLSKIFTAVNFTDYLTNWHDKTDVHDEGLAYNELSLTAHVADNTLILDKTTIKGKGVNLSGRGTIDLSDLNADLTFFIAPFKIIDSVVTGIPLLGKALGGPKESILTFPVSVTGNIKSPEVTSLAPEAVGNAAWELFKDTVTLPLRLLTPDPTTPEKPADESR